METATIVILAVVAAVILIVLLLVVMYNGLVRRRNEVENAWSQIDVQLSRRHDLIPNLVETVKGYTKHERAVLENITRARSAAVNAQGVVQQARAEDLLTNALGRLRVTVESYPDLKASQNYLALQEELASTENKIAFSRQFYNDSVMRLNTSIESFPANLIASPFGFHKAELFEIEDPAARQAQKVSFE